MRKYIYLQEKIKCRAQNSKMGLRSLETEEEKKLKRKIKKRIYVSWETIKKQLWGMTGQASPCVPQQHDPMTYCCCWKVVLHYQCCGQSSLLPRVVATSDRFLEHISLCIRGGFPIFDTMTSGTGLILFTLPSCGSILLLELQNSEPMLMMHCFATTPTVGRCFYYVTGSRHCLVVLAQNRNTGVIKIRSDETQLPFLQQYCCSYKMCQAAILSTDIRTRAAVF